MNLRGKKLLLTGGSNSAAEIAAFAEKHGIVLAATGTGGLTPLKAIAQEVYDVDTTDTEAMIQLARDIHADGIFAGGNEPNIGVAIQVAEALGFPYYVNEAQFEMNRNKNYFKETCRKFGLQTPENFALTMEFDPADLAKIRYPVVVKPIDSCGGNGVGICGDEAALRRLFTIAYHASPSQRALVEEYAVGDEVTAVYTLKDGEISLSAFKDKLLSQDHPYIASQYDVSTIPSKYLDRFVAGDNDKIIRMLKTLGFANGTLFFQGIAQPDRFVFFEMGCRLSGAGDYRAISKENGINFLEMLLCFSLTGRMDGYDLSMDTPYFKKNSTIFQILAHGGTIGALEGLEAARTVPGVTKAEYLHDVGDTIVEDGSLRQRVFRAYVTAPTRQEVAKIIAEVQTHVKCRNTAGENMLYLPFDVNRLL